MAYSLRQDMRDGFPRIDTVVLDDPEYDAVIKKWDSVIDGYLAHRYTVPFHSTTDAPSTPPLIRMLSMTFARADILRRSQRMEDWVRAEVEEAWNMLKALAAGEMNLVDPNGAIVEPRTDREPALSNTVDYVPVFGGVDDLTERFSPQRRRDERAARDPTNLDE